MEDRGIAIIHEAEVEVVMSKEEAAQLTQDIKSTSTALYVLLKKAHDTKAWIAMGYNSWSEYISREFDFSRTRSYQLINQANVIEEINEASGVPMYISERDARSIKNRLPEITEKIEVIANDKNLSENEVESKVKEIIDEEVDNANGSKGNGIGNYDEEQDLEKDDNGAMEEWKPDGIDMDKMRKMLSDEDKFYFDNLIVTLKIFESMPDPVSLGRTIRDSSQEKKELIKLSESAFSWITRLLDEIE